MAERHGLIEAYSYIILQFIFRDGIPWQNATASLKLADTEKRLHEALRIPWQNATASLKLARNKMTMDDMDMNSVAERHGLIEARTPIRSRLP